MGKWLLPKNWAIALIRVYQKFSSRTAPVCRFTPTCSAYAAEAIGRFGLLIGGTLALWRILRCNPLFKGGYDPVPQRILWMGKGSSQEKKSQ